MVFVQSITSLAPVFEGMPGIASRGIGHQSAVCVCVCVCRYDVRHEGRLSLLALRCIQ